uniref:Putative PAS/PAC sensor protein n=1 Tax=Cyanothece sp. (strain PCC 7425 / ATCC 29141) TaxID=395961 RepID=B8HKS6_CYAP4
MDDAEIRLYFHRLREQISAWQAHNLRTGQELEAALEDLHLIYEEMQTKLQMAEVVEQGLLQQNQQIALEYYRYQDWFDAAPIAYLVADVNGLILQANQAMAQLLNVPQRYLAGKPLTLYLAETDRANFRTKLNQLSPNAGPQVWQLNLCPRDDQPVVTEWHIAIALNPTGGIASLRIGIYPLSQGGMATGPETIADLIPAQPLEQIQAQGELAMSPLPPRLDGLRVLVVDDEADIRDFIIAVLEAHGIEVRAVASAAVALEEIERYRPDVLLSDIRMPDRDGYSLIRQIRALEAEQGRHLPAAAITAYLEEDREKAVRAGFEAHLHKLAQPREWIEMVAQLVEQTANRKLDELD